MSLRLKIGIGAVVAAVSCRIRETNLVCRNAVSHGKLDHTAEAYVLGEVIGCGHKEGALLCCTDVLRGL